MYTLRLTTNFSAAHQLTNAYDKKCNDSIHGHNWKVLIEITSSTLKNNMVIDFTRLKEIVNQLDHKNLNELLDFEPTAELIAKYLHDKIKFNLKDNKKSKTTITIWEADNSSITYTK
jgi:6-pyruvoyltetrahydropterin/6-carboxytetrahydropterin synthase